jgi:hypothetical protein
MWNGLLINSRCKQGYQRNLQNTSLLRKCHDQNICIRQHLLVFMKGAAALAHLMLTALALAVYWSMLCHTNQNQRIRTLSLWSKEHINDFIEYLNTTPLLTFRSATNWLWLSWLWWQRHCTQRCSKPTASLIFNGKCNTWVWKQILLGHLLTTHQGNFDGTH